MNKLNLLAIFACLFIIFSGILADRKSVEKCLSYSKPDIVFDGPSSKKCHLQQIIEIVDGTFAKPKTLPHAAIIGYIRDQDFSWACMGTLISEDYVLTAGHCLTFRHGGTPTKVRFGDFAQSPNGVESQEAQIAEFIVHPDFNAKDYKNDIALIKLKEPVKLNDFVRPACLYPTVEISETQGLYGGRKAETSKDVKKTTLIQVLATILPKSRCTEVYATHKNGFNEDGSQFCAATHRAEGDHCRGESGSALVLDSKTPCMYDIVGFVTRGSTCGKAENPDIYTTVPKYLDWIEQTVWQ